MMLLMVCLYSSMVMNFFRGMSWYFLFKWVTLKYLRMPHILYMTSWHLYSSYFKSSQHKLGVWGFIFLIIRHSSFLETFSWETYYENWTFKSGMYTLIIIFTLSKINSPSRSWLTVEGIDSYSFFWYIAVLISKCTKLDIDISIYS